MTEAKSIPGDRMTAQTPGPVARWERLLAWTPEQTPPHFKERDGYEDGDEDSPFLSEAYLYNLLGKEDARTLLALLSRYKEAHAAEDARKDAALRPAREALRALTYAISKVAYFAEETRVGRAIKQAEAAIAAIDEVLHG